MIKTVQSGKIEIEVDGQTYRGLWKLDSAWLRKNQVLTVSTSQGSTSTQLGRLRPEVLMGTLLRELVSAGRAQPCSGHH